MGVDFSLFRRMLRIAGIVLMVVIQSKLHFVVQPTSMDPIQSARQAGLRYVTDASPGIKRRRWGRGFTFLDAGGERITDKQLRSRLKSLPIPPAWQDVWICPDPQGHLLATGRDARGRKQHRYHPDWEKIRSQVKFERMVPFAEGLPQLRKQVRQDLIGSRLTQKKVVAVVVRLLQKTLIRVGNDEYAENNDSFGLTTLQNRHVDIAQGSVRFEFRGKSGVEHEIDLEDPRSAKLIRRCQELPGQALFQYFDETEALQSVESGEVNDYLKRVLRDSFTAKDFRTWFGTVCAAESLVEQGWSQDESQLEANIKQAIAEAAAQLGNRPATCRKYYVHPQILNRYREGPLPWKDGVSKNAEPWELSRSETAVLELLRHTS